MVRRDGERIVVGKDQIGSGSDLVEKSQVAQHTCHPW